MKAVLAIAAGMTVAILKDTQDMLHKVNDVKWTSEKAKAAMPLIIKQWNDLDIENDPDPIKIIKQCKLILKGMLVILKLDYDANINGAEEMKGQAQKSIEDEDETGMDALVKGLLGLSLQSDAETDKKLMKEIIELLEKYFSVCNKHPQITTG